MKINKLSIILFIVIIGLSSYIVYDKVINKVKNENEFKEELKIIKKIELEYLKIYLMSNGESYIEPIKPKDIAKLNKNQNLKDRLNSIYDKSKYFDIYINDYKLKGFKTNVNEEITDIVKINFEDNDYIIFIKKDSTIALFDYLDYIDNLNIEVLDNYKNIQNVLEIKDNKVIYLDGNEGKLFN